MRNRARVPMVVTACVVGALLAGAAVVAAARLGRPERVWAFVPSPPWSEDPPPHAAAENGGPPLDAAEWNTVLGTSGGGPSSVIVVHRPSAFFARFLRAFGRAPRVDTYHAVDDGLPAPGGRWHDCALIDGDPAPAAAPGAAR